MSAKKYFILICVIIALSAGAYHSEKTFLVPRNISTTKSPKVKPPEIEVKPQSRPRSPEPRSAPVTPATAPAPNFTLSVGGSSHAAFAPVGSTVLDAMRVLASTSNFTFTGKEYPSLGFFVESINGQKAESGHNWILYVNGKLSGTGASQTTLKAGDAIEWRYEENY